jgi:CHAT domain-containing protein
MTTFTDLARFQQTGNRLFRQLIAPLKVRTQKMIVIPDGPLHYLPFAALPTAIADVETTRALPYLIRQHVISRNFSASVLFQHQTIDAGKSRTLKPLLIVSPAAFPNDSRLSLDPAGLAAEFGDQARIERDVTKETFRRLLREGYENIFLFTHASASGDDPFLLLFEDTLFLRELYATPVASNLVLLGACETGLGQNRRGEGVLSLAHGFAYQNVPKTLMTLWKVQDSAALRISLDFLRLHLLEQKPMAEALRQAKLNYIADPKGDGRPFIWAGFVGVGRE